MALFGREPSFTKVPTGLYGYDLAAEDTAQQIGQARRQGDSRQIYGAGGLSGAALRQRGEMEGAFMDASIRAVQQRRAQEMQRKEQEAAIREQRRRMVQQQEMKNLANALSGVTALGQDIQSRASGIKKRRMTPEGIGDDAAVQDLVDRGLIRMAGGTEDAPLYGYTAKGGAREFFSDPYWGTPSSVPAKDPWPAVREIDEHPYSRR